MQDLSFDLLADLTGGRHGVHDVPCPLCGPDRRAALNKRRKVLRVWRKEPDFVTYQCMRCDAHGYVHLGGVNANIVKTPIHKHINYHDKEERRRRKRQEMAKTLWTAAAPLPGTLGETYFTETRGHDSSRLNLSHVLRWHQLHGAVIALMTDPTTNKPAGVHRTFIDRDGTKLERKMLGRKGVIRLTPDEDVAMGLGICEGIEDGIAILISGFAPVWATADCGAMKAFPVLEGIESLTIFPDAGDSQGQGEDAAAACALRWVSADRDATISKGIFQ